MEKHKARSVVRLNKYWGIVLPLFALTLTSCASDLDIEFTDDTPLILNLESPSLRVMQVTDLHLTYGFDANDQKTYELIEKLAEHTQPDIIVLTGDLTMSPLAPSLYRQLTRRVDKIGIPWTFIFGNHDNDFNSYKKNLDAVAAAKPEHLLFKVGPELMEGGFGNFIIQARYQSAAFHNLYMLDTKNENGGLNDYDWLSEAQVDWYGSHAAADALLDVTSSVYMHIPLLQYEEYINYDLIDGQMGEDRVYPQGQETGFFDEMVAHGVSKGVFAGHDHLSNFSFLKDGILLAYGQTSGYNGYGQIERGARIIEVDELGNLTSYLVLDQEVGL
ncbi:MAG TPA: metallophosphoesterase [Bacilli bacterium]|nr:metallophosphoesterase [Bacilli bacterium]